MSFLKEFWEFIVVRRKYWLLPILLMMAFCGALLLLPQGSPITPFIYTMF